MQVYNNELYHFGKLGMKWGHRKTKVISKTDSRKKTALNASRIALFGIGGLVLSSHTNLSAGKIAVLSILGSELGSLAVSKALKMDTKALAKKSAVRSTQYATYMLSKSLLDQHTKLDPFQRSMASLAIGGVGAVAVNKLLNGKQKTIKTITKV